MILEDGSEISFSFVDKEENIPGYDIQPGGIVYVQDGSYLAILDGGKKAASKFYDTSGEPGGVITWDGEKAVWSGSGFKSFKLVKTEQAVMAGKHVWVNRKLTGDAQLKKYFCIDDDELYTIGEVDTEWSIVDKSKLAPSILKYCVEGYFMRIPSTTGPDDTEYDTESTLFLLDRVDTDSSDNLFSLNDLYYCYDGEWNLVGSNESAADSNVIDTTYDDFKSLVDTNSLKPGRRYKFSYTPVYIPYETEADKTNSYWSYDITVTALGYGSYDHHVEVSVPEDVTKADWDKHNMVSFDTVSEVDAWWSCTLPDDKVYNSYESTTGYVYRMTYLNSEYYGMDIVGTNRYNKSAGSVSSRFTDCYNINLNGKYVKAENLKCGLSHAASISSTDGSTVRGVDNSSYTVESFNQYYMANVTSVYEYK